VETIFLLREKKYIYYFFKKFNYLYQIVVMFNTYCIFIILSILSIIIIKVYYYFKKVEEFNNFIATGKYGKKCKIIVGKVYSCGYNKYGQLGLNSTNDKEEPQLIQTYYGNGDAITITKIACGSSYSLFLTNDGRVYSCGYNYYGQLGLNYTYEQINYKTTPKIIETFYDNEIKITKIACGSSHSLFLTNDGRVYSCGYNYYGQLGLNSTNNQKAPQLIQTFYNKITITEIAGGAYHSLFLTNEGYVYSCGYNYKGQLGLNYTYEQINYKTTPQLIQTYYDYGNAVKDEIKITKIACGYYHSLFLTNDGHVYSCGYNYFGQLGLNSTNNQEAPQLIQTYYDYGNAVKDEIKISKIAGGSFHSLFLTNEGHVYSCGYNYYGQLGLNYTNNQKAPQLIQTFYNKITITEIAGSYHSLFLTNEGYVYSCGKGALGQLGLKSKKDKKTPIIIETFYNNGVAVVKDEIKITKIACGGNHSFFIRKNLHTVLND
jgi:alpha-tubulin suppressor-like RCC1 family protein